MSSTALLPLVAPTESGMSKPFYHQGLHFECTQCHNCCRYEPGYVFLSESDIARLAKGKRMSRGQFLDAYCRTVRIGGAKMISLTEKPNYDCIFWDNGCTVYEHRPLQCRSYPFWGVNLESESAWRELSAVCPGANRGKLHTRAEIEQWLKARHEDPPIVL